MKHCTNNKADRKLGGYWERAFCQLAARTGKTFSPLQIGRDGSAQAYFMRVGRWHSRTLPDVTVWTSPGEHHEIKHKNPTRSNCFGLEVYRFDALVWFAGETGQNVMYTIHNHDLSGGRNGRINKLDHWFTQNILSLQGAWQYEGNFPSWVNGQKKIVPQYFWSIDLWVPLGEYWLAEKRTQNLAVRLPL